MIALWTTMALLGVVGWIIYQFNTLVGLSNDIDEAWAQIDLQFVRRYDLAARVLEGSSLDKLAAARNAFTPGEKSKTEPALVAALTVAPDAEVRQTLADIEDYLRTAGQNYNEMVDDLNERVSRFPQNLLADLFGVVVREQFLPETK